jgi:hypothetical protein
MRQKKEPAGLTLSVQPCENVHVHMVNALRVTRTVCVRCHWKHTPFSPLNYETAAVPHMLTLASYSLEFFIHQPDGAVF